jgi:hypothetical protein
MRDDMLYRIARSDPWYTDIVNFMVEGMYDQEPTRKSLFTRVTITCGMNHTFFKYALMGYSGGVYRQKKDEDH